MRRLLAIALTLLLGLSPLAPALAQSGQRTVMLCCRKGNTHDCTGAATRTSPTVRAHCPMLPETLSAAHGNGWGAPTNQSDDEHDEVSTLLGLRLEAGYRVSFDRSRYKRGPPANNLSWL